MRKHLSLFLWMIGVSDYLQNASFVRKIHWFEFISAFIFYDFI